MSTSKSFKYLAVASMLLMGSASWAQPGTPVMTDPTVPPAGDNPVKSDWEPSLVRDGAYDRMPHRMTPMDPQYLREADVLWKRRVWREIDARQKQNEAFIYPGDDETGGGMFIEIIMDAIKTGKVKPYSALGGGDRFTKTLSIDQIREMVSGTPDSTPVYNPETDQTTIVVTQRDFNPEDFTHYRVKEDWIFDRNLGRMVVRIIGIAPLKQPIDPVTGMPRGKPSPVFWLYYPELRKTLAQYEVYNPENDVQRLTWSDYLESRFWSGRIIQTSNSVNQFRYTDMGVSDVEQLYQGQRDMDEIVNKEIDMWSY